MDHFSAICISYVEGKTWAGSEISVNVLSHIVHYWSFGPHWKSFGQFLTLGYLGIFLPGSAELMVSSKYLTKDTLSFVPLKDGLCQALSSLSLSLSHTHTQSTIKSPIRVVNVILFYLSPWPLLFLAFLSSIFVLSRLPLFIVSILFLVFFFLSCLPLSRPFKV